ncbi:DNA methylase, partial [Sulfolobus sp. B1]
ERKRVLNTFKNMSSGILVLTTVGDEGIDIPDANVGIIVTGTGSRRQFIQRLGRILRPYDGKRAKLYEIIVSGTSEEYQARRRKETEILSFDQSDELDDM